MVHSVRDLVSRVVEDRLRRDLFYLSSNPLRFRKVNYTVPGHSVCSLEETDAYLTEQLGTLGYEVTRRPYRVRPFRCDESKPLHHWYSVPAADDPWYTAHNIEAEIKGAETPEEILVLVSHKDSMSWIDSPGAHDNCTGTVANLEIARVLADASPRRTIRFLFCNEEHTPWTSRFAAEEAIERGDRIIAVMNQDSLAGKSDAQRARGALAHAVCYSTDEGRELAERIAAVNAAEEIGLELDVVHKKHVNDDDGMFIKAGYRRTVMNVGSFPYADSEYHLVGDVPERVDLENLVRSTRLVLASVLHLDQD